MAARRVTGRVGEITRGVYQLEPFSSDDVAQAGRIMERYADLRIGLADAPVVVLATRHRTLELSCCPPSQVRAA